MTAYFLARFDTTHCDTSVSTERIMFATMFDTSVITIAINKKKKKNLVMDMINR